MPCSGISESRHIIRARRGSETPPYTWRCRLQLYCSPTLRPVDTPPPSPHFFPVSKKPHKIKGTTKPNAGIARPNIPTQKSPAEFKPRYADEATARECMDKVFRVHGDLLRRLAEYDRNG